MSRNYDFVSLWHPDEYPLCEGQIVSSSVCESLRVTLKPTLSNSMSPLECAACRQSVRRWRVFGGPLARFNLCGDKLPEIAKQAARDAKLPSRCQNPFQSIIVRAVELVFACDEALANRRSLSPVGTSLRRRQSLAMLRELPPPVRRVGCSTSVTKSARTAPSPSARLCRPFTKPTHHRGRSAHGCKPRNPST